MKNLTVKYCPYSNTLRQWPQNCCLATRHQKRWVLDFDIASNKLILQILLGLLLDYNSHYVLTAEQLADKINDIYLFKQLPKPKPTFLERFKFLFNF